jgi:hypothetical protein
MRKNIFRNSIMQSITLKVILLASSLKYAFIVPTIFLLSSCASMGTSEPFKFHSETALGKMDVATLRDANEGLLGGSVIRIMTINGKPGPQGGFGYSSPWDGSFNIELLPGKYDLSVQYIGTYQHSRRPVTIELNAKAGHIYQIDYKFDDDLKSVSFSIVDVSETTSP